MRDPTDFLEHIADSPDDDSVRLVYADWLEEHGQPARAEFIRIQCQGARLPWHDLQRAAYEKRASELFEDHRNEWLGNFETLVRSARFERGFVETVSISAEKFVRNADEILSHAPVRRFSMNNLSDALASKIAQMPALGKMREIKIDGHNLSDSGWRALLGSQELKQLESLHFKVGSDSGIHSTVVLDALNQCPSLPSLKELHPSYCSLGLPGNLRQFQDLHLPSIERLFLSRINADPLGLVGGMYYFPQLAELDLSHNQLSNHESINGIDEPAVNLKTLHLNHCRLCDSYVRNFARRKLFPNVENLDVSNNAISSSSLMYLLTSLPQLRRLIADGNTLDGSRLQTSLRKKTFPELKEFSGKRIRNLNASEVQVFAEAFCLEKLTLSSCNLTDGDVEPLLKSDHATELFWLDLSDNQLTDQTAATILNSPKLDQLRYLSLKRNEISDDFKDALRTKLGVGVCAFDLY